MTQERFQQNWTKCSTYHHDDLDIAFVHNNYDPDPADTTHESTFVWLIRRSGKLEIETDRHLGGIFPLQTWLDLLQYVGFDVTLIEPQFEAPMFVCVKCDSQDRFLLAGMPQKLRLPKSVETSEVCTHQLLGRQLVFCSQPITHVIARRFSCRSYSDVAIEDKTRRRLEDFLAALPASPFGATTRFALIAATEHDRSALRGLGTYGFIKGAAAFIVGAVRPAAMNLEDFG